MAELVIHTSMDSLFDVLNCASAITVLTEAYDELSHGTLVSRSKWTHYSIRQKKTNSVSGYPIKS